MAGQFNNESGTRAVEINMLTYSVSIKTRELWMWQIQMSAVKRCSGSNLRLSFDHFSNGRHIFELGTQLGYDNRVRIRHNSILITFSLINMLIILHSNYWEQSSASWCRFDVSIVATCRPLPSDVSCRNRWSHFQ